MMPANDIKIKILMADTSAPGSQNNTAPVDRVSLTSLIKASPAMHLISASELAEFIASVEQLSDDKKTVMVKIFTDEQEQLRAIKAEYDEKAQALFREYVENLKTEEKKMVTELQKQVETVDRSRETGMLDNLLDSLHKL
jgi:hypothetical protein